MSLWGAKDAVSNTSQEWVAAFGKKGNTANRTAFYGNTTTGAFTANMKVGVVAISATEMTKGDQRKITSATVSAGGANYANGDVVRLSTGVATTNAEFTVTTGAGNTSVVSLVISNAGVFTSPPSGTSATNNKTAANASANGLVIRVVFSSVTEGKKAPHTGWNVRKEFTGGRAGRVQYETLVAGGITTDNPADDPLVG